MYFEVINNDEFNGRKEVLGTVKFPLVKIERQDEYDLELEIPDDNDDNVIMAKINAKIQFIWSIYKYYQDQLTKSERVLQNCQAMLTKTNKLLENLNEPMKYIEASQDRFVPVEIARPESNSVIVFKSPNEGENSKQYQYADQIENFIKNTLST